MQAIQTIEIDNHSSRSLADSILSKFDEQSRLLAEKLADGGAVDYPDYKRISATIKTFAQCSEIVRQALRESGGDSDF